MTKKATKNFSIFWLLAGIIWLIAAVRHLIVTNDITGVIIYAAAGVLSFVLAFAYYWNFVK